MNLLNECHNSKNVSLEASGCTRWHAVGWPTEKYTDNALTNTLITRDHFKFTVQDCCKKSGIISLRISQCCLSMPTGWPGRGRAQGLFISRHFQCLGVGGGES